MASFEVAALSPLGELDRYNLLRVRSASRRVALLGEQLEASAATLSVPSELLTGATRPPRSPALGPKRAYTPACKRCGTESEAVRGQGKPARWGEGNTGNAGWLRQAGRRSIRSRRSASSSGWVLPAGCSLFLGVFFLSMGMLRLLQQVFEENFASLLPYVVTVVVLLAAIGIIFSLFSRSKKRVLS
ncbi:MAG: hypothetical protein R2710_24320 [Acidimicrobiales bacterium]